MAEKRPGVFARTASPLLEIKTRKKYTYDQFVTKAAEKLGLTNKEGKGKVLSLFKLSGAKILDEPLMLNGKQKDWNLGNYLLMLRKAANKTKLGVGFISLQDNLEQVCMFVTKYINCIKV